MQFCCVPGEKGKSIELQDLLNLGETVAKLFQKLWKDTETVPPVTDLHTTCLLDVVNAIISCQIGLPR